MSDDEPRADDAETADVADTAAQPGADNAVSSRRRESKQRKQRREKQEAEQFWRNVFASAVGRREMWRIVAGADGAHAFETRFLAAPNGAPDPIASWYSRGEQDLGLRLYHAWLAAHPREVALMHQENDDRFKPPSRNKDSE